MPTLPEAVLTHVSAGRVRFKVPSRKRDDGFFQQLTDRLASFPGVERVQANPLTGSVLVLHSLQLASREDLEPLAASAAAMALFTIAASPASPPASPSADPQHGLSLGQTIAITLADLNEQLRGATNGLVDLPTVAIVGLLGLSIRQIREGALLIPAVSAIWYASSLLKDQLAGLEQTHQIAHRGRHGSQANA